ncbi:MAG: peptidylprolyl isomerase [Halobacteriovoraceae bacterium]|jgi:parvulin-like peptidyl-prolyl isomerase|nr:peptidylprolyl isomerase [Halobacteriovoraceae bacterium]
MTTRYRAQHILLEDEDDVSYILEQLDQGVSFEFLAKQYSECDTAQTGGHLGRFSSGSMSAEFEKALYHLKQGEVSGGVRTKYGFHVIKRL